MKGYFLIACVCVILMSLLCSGHALGCFRCDLGFWNLCFTTKTNCSSHELCYVGIGKAASVVDVKEMGCLAAKECNKTTDVEFFNKTLYTMKKSCCGEDFCNAGPALQLSLNTLIILILAQMIGLS
nr:sperm acrosome membrane-associated protein 4-like [Misgurnus anguillicaudatus]